MLISSAWIYLTVIGQDILGDAPKRLAWLLPLGPSPWEQTTKHMVPQGTTLSEVIHKLGQPDQITEPLVGGNIQQLKYVNPHDSSRFIIVTLGPDGKVISTSTGSPNSR